MLRFLYIDTSSEFSHILLMNDTSILYEIKSELPNEHAQKINIYIATILQTCNVSFSDLNAVVVVNGPGSYTGLRIGLASAKGFCFAYDIPLILLNRFQLLLQTVSKELCEYKGFIIQARQDEFYFQYFENDKLVNDENVKSKAEIETLQQKLSMKIYGLDQSLMSIFSGIEIFEIQNEAILFLCNQSYSTKNFANLIDAEPFYIKNVFINKINKL